jgi:hypothetical protein
MGGGAILSLSLFAIGEAAVFFNNVNFSYRSQVYLAISKKIV